MAQVQSVQSVSCDLLQVPPASEHDALPIQAEVAPEKCNPGSPVASVGSGRGAPSGCATSETYAAPKPAERTRGRGAMAQWRINGSGVTGRLLDRPGARISRLHAGSSAGKAIASAVL